MTISRKIGPHIINSTGLALSKPAVVKLVDPSRAYYDQVRVQVGSDCLIVVRWYHPAQDLSAPAQNAWGWWQAHRDWIVSVPGTDRVVYEGWNEIGDSLAPQYASFELARLQLLHSAGRRACVLNSSVGTPDLGVWPVYAPMLAHMQPGDVVGLHEYWSDRADIDNLWHVRRFTLPAVARNLAGRQIVVTECGRDIVEGKGQPGWQHTTDAAGFLADLRHLGELYDGCANVVGACVFQTGSSDPQWGPFNVYGLWPSVVSEYAAPTAPPVTAPPVPTPLLPALRLSPPIAERDIVRNPDGSLRVTQRFNPPSHFGIDYSCVVGKPIRAAIDGTAYCETQTVNGVMTGFGRYVRLEDGKGTYVYTAHLSTFAIYDRTKVHAGDLIGYSGNTGNSTGPHLHFEVRRGSRLQAAAIDPEPLIVWPVPETPQPPPQPTEPFLPTNDPIMLARKTPKERYEGIRYWIEEAERQDEDHMPEYARAIRLALIEQMYRWEGE